MEVNSKKVIALAGNPNVGKSTVFNALTGKNQHTGNWIGKTVANAYGYCDTDMHSYVMVDIPGTYSLMAHSREEEVARNFICFGKADAIVVVCDATCLERNLNLALQIMEITPNVLICVNLLDEAKRKGIHIDMEQLSRRLGVPVVGTVARDKKNLHTLLAQLDLLTGQQQSVDRNAAFEAGTVYADAVEEALAVLVPAVREQAGEIVNARWLSLRLLEGDCFVSEELQQYMGKDIINEEHIQSALMLARDIVTRNNISITQLRDGMISTIFRTSEHICGQTVSIRTSNRAASDRKIDAVLTGKWLGYPVMLLLLAVVLWITIAGANYPSQLLAQALFGLEEKLLVFLRHVGAPQWFYEALVLGVYRVLAWVVSVMLPPMGGFKKSQKTLVLYLF